MTTMVTGATGFVGLNVVEQLLSRGETVVAFSARPFPQKILTAFRALPGTLVAYEGDVRDRNLVLRALSEHGVTCVLHGAVITANAARESKCPKKFCR